jgi:acetyl-CoA carboxylase carboxyltransferase component
MKKGTAVSEQESSAKSEERLEAERAFSLRLGAHNRRARERVEELLDPGSFIEIGLLARDVSHGRREKSAADAVVTGYGTVNGHRVGVISHDRAVLGGSNGHPAEAKNMRVLTEAERVGFPVISFGEGGGGRIPDLMGSAFGQIGAITRTQSLSFLARRDRRFTVIGCSMGEMYGDPSFVLGLSDFPLMVRSACFAVSGPPIIQAATGEVISGMDLGGPAVHERIGQVARVEESEADLLGTIRQLLAFTLERKRSSSDDPDRLTPELGHIIPDSPRRAYDVRRVIRLLADQDCEPLILWPSYGRSLVCALARMGGHSVAVLASQSLHRGGVMDAETARKGAKLIDQAQRLRLPLVFLIDVPGFIVGSEPEQQGLLSASMDYLRSLASTDVPKIGLVLRKANGFGYFALGGPGWGGDYTAALPSARIAFMGPEAGIGLIYQRKLEQIADPAERERERERLNAEWNARAEPWEAAHAASLDEVIQPAEARRTLVRVIEALDRP